MSKLPWFKFFPSWWISDPQLSMCTPAARGVWMDLLCAMHQSDRSGILSGTTDQIARLGRCSTVELTHVLTELQATGTADVTFRNNNVTIVNRLMKREAKARQDTALRVAKHRSNAQCNANETVQKEEVRSKRIENTSTPNGVVPSNPTKVLKGEYVNLQEEYTGKDPAEVYKAIKVFVGEKTPAFLEPYLDAWNIFAGFQNLSKAKPTEHRRRKIATRAREPDFDFFRILTSIKQNPDYRGENKSGWRVDFNFIIESEKNYISILERYKEH